MKLSTRIKKKGLLKLAMWDIAASFVRGRWRDTLFFVRWRFSDYSDAWYISLFSAYRGIKGEVTPSYSILNRPDIHRVYNLAPHAKIILILRNPIERAWSHYLHKKRKIKEFSVENRESEIIEFIESQEQLLRSDYIRTLNEFSAVFPKGQILICFYDALVDMSGVLLNDIVKFIHDHPVDLVEKLDLEEIINPSFGTECPSLIHDYLKKKYHGQISHLAHKYGRYFSKWHRETYPSDLNIETGSLRPSFSLK